MPVTRARLRLRHTILGMLVAVLAALVPTGLSTTPASAADAYDVTATILDADYVPASGWIDIYYDAGAPPADGVPPGYAILTQGFFNDGALSLSLEPGTYKFGILNSAYNPGEPGYYNWYAGGLASPDMADAVPVTVEYGPVELNYIQLPPVDDGTYAVSAVVHDELGNGLASTLDAFRDDGWGFETSWSMTDWNGIFSVANGSSLDLPPGTYRFRLTNDRDGQVTWIGGTDLGTADDYVIDADLSLGTIVFHQSMVSGTVTRTGGVPVANATVGIENEDFYRSDRTDALGRFVLPAVPEGEYALRADDDAEALLFEPTTVVVERTNLTRDILMQVRPRITGTITNTRTQPLRGIDVIALDAFGEPAGGSTTNAAGVYDLHWLEPGTYWLVFTDTAGQYLTEYWNNATSPDSAASIDLGVAEVEANKNVVLALDPAPRAGVVDLKGRVTGPNGIPVDGITVDVYAPGELLPTSQTRTDHDGNYAFRDLVSGSYQLFFFANDEEESYDPAYLPYVNEYSGHKQDRKLAATVAVNEDSSSPAVYDMVLPRLGEISGTVTSANSNRPLTEVWVYVADADEADAGWSTVDGLGRYRALVPPGTHKVGFDGTSYADGVGWTSFIREYWNNSTTLAGARTVTVGSGQRVTGVNATLTVDLEALAPPRILGTPVVGRTLTAGTGSWNLTAQNTYVYTWLRGTAVAQTGTSPTYLVKAADAGQVLTVRVEATHQSLQAVATSAAVRPKHASTTAVVGASPKARVAKLVVTVRVPGLASVGGTLVVRRGAKVVKTGVALVNGTAVVTLKRQPAGRQGYTVTYSGTAKVLPSSGAVTVRVRR